MVNVNVVYQRADGASASLWAEVQAWAGGRAQTKGFVAGSGATTWNVTSHNADSLGVAHAVDLGVDIEGDGTGLTLAQADWLAEHLREMGRIDWAAGRPGRLAYIIYKRRIAGDHTGWAWVAYGGASPHLDHIHVSTCFDFYWGDPVWGTPQSVWDDRSPWGVSGAVTPAGGGSITPIEEDDMFTDQDRADLSTALGTAKTIVGMLNNIAGGVNATPNATASAILDKEIPRADGGTTSLALQLSYAGADRAALLNDVKTAIAALPPAQIADIIPADLVSAVADELGKRVSNG